MSSVLKMENVTKRFGGLVAVDHFNGYINPGELIGLIGPNGAGKTTLFNLITGVYAPDKGKILFFGKDISGHKPHQIAAYGIARTFQNIRLFSDMTVLENVMVSQHLRLKTGCGSSKVLLRHPMQLKWKDK